MNAISTIHPYKFFGQWVFDDPAVGLIREPFVSGADLILDQLASDIPHAESGMTVLFSATPFPGYTHAFERQREEFGGYWYKSQTLGKEGWLCPALFKYFSEAPASLYIQCKPKG